jgi:hypothetical protein
VGQFRSPGFEVNDLGFGYSADWAKESAFVGYEQFTPGKRFRAWRVYANQFAGWTWGGERFSNGLNLNGGFELWNQWSGFATVTSLFPRTSVDALRGGPALRSPPLVNGTVGFDSDPRRKLTANLAVGVEREDQTGARTTFAGGGLAYRPSTRTQVSLSPEVTLSSGYGQFLDAPEVGGTTRYLFGGLRQRTVSLTARLNYTFAPNLSLQVYAQPFISAGEFTRFRLVADPGASRFGERFHVFTPGEIAYDPVLRSYAVDLNGDATPELSFGNPDFSFRELRSNTVLRWEYRPGSTLFLAWGQGKTQPVANGDFRLFHDVAELFGTRGSNVLLVKVSYWLNP